MRRFQQEKILESLNLLDEAQNELAKNSARVSLGLLGDMQDCVQKVGEYIESLVGNSTYTVALLEKYHELLYRISTGEEKAERLNCALVEIKNSVNNELKPNKIEIAFLSYKASMSDAVITIYLAAKEDVACDAYFIPIPYFTLNSDGSFGKIEFEGQECYPGIECTDWCNYNLEERHPDVIFSFSGYDENNFVTSVHPSFYFERLQNFTSLLCYSPYFVSINNYVPKPFATIPGCFYADRVFVESEEIRQQYISHFQEFEYEQNCKGMFGSVEDKFVALGSPKLDCIVNADRKDIDLPSDWRQLIGNRKVIFYNTTLTGLLKDSEQYMKRLRNTLLSFRKNSDVALWWRPHPLSIATVKSMRPALAAEYIEIAKQYKCEGWGIYDDTVDLHRAIAVSDGYYGDWSSVVTMYEATGKPIVIQQKHNISLLFDALCECGDFYWGAAVNYKGLFKIDKKTLNPIFVTEFKDELNTIRLYCGVTNVDSKLFFTPISGDNFAVFDMNKSKLVEIPIRKPKNLENYDEKRKFYGSVVYDGNVYFFGDSYPGMAKIDINSLDVAYIEDCFPQNNGIGHTRKINQRGNMVTTIHKSSQRIINIDLDTMEVKTVKQLDFGAKRFLDTDRLCVELCECGDYFYSSVVNGDTVLKIHNKDYSVKILKIPDNLCGKKHNYISEYWAGYLWFFPVSPGKPIKINTNNDEMVLATEFLPLDYIENNTVDMEFTYRGPLTSYGDCLHCFENQSKQFIEYNHVTGVMRRASLTLGVDGEIAATINKISGKTYNAIHKDNNAKVGSSAGSKIYKYCKSTILGS